MTKGEIKGLQGLALAHGGSLSINPDTGLVEASFLKNLLPMIAGAGLMLIPGVGPLAAAGMVGGFETVRTGDIGKGLMAGLGAYGGAGLAQGLSTAGASAAEAAIPEATKAAAAESAGTMGNQFAYNAAGEMVPANYAPSVTGAAQGTAQVAAPGTSAPSYLSKMGSGIRQLGTEAGRSAVYNALPGYTLPAAGVSLANAMTPEAPSMPGQPEEEERYKNAPYRYNLSPNFSGYVPRQPKPYYRPTGLGYAAGGLADDEPMGDDASYASGGKLQMKTMGLGDGIYRDTDDDTASLGAYDAAIKRMEKQHAAANLKPKEMPKSGIARLGQMKAMASGGLGSYSDGGRMLKGPGDGMSDSIPATIGRKQPARLADGEFVVPADVVSHLGNGSTDAGAKKLYSMMDKVRSARTGKKKQAPAVKADKYMPA
jgi:hypothetical protein